MNDKINLPALVQLLALRSGDTKKQAEDFIKTLFKEIGDVLAAEDFVKLKGIGVFKVIEVEARKSVNVSTGEDHEIPAHRKVVFIPDKDLAAAVNEPFSMFETVELVDEMPPSEQSQELNVDDNEEPDEVHNEIYELKEPDSPIEPDSVSTDSISPISPISPIDPVEPIGPISPIGSDNPAEVKPRSGSRFGLGFLCGVLVTLFCIALGFCAAYFILPGKLPIAGGAHSDAVRSEQTPDMSGQNGGKAVTSAVGITDTVAPSDGNDKYAETVEDEAPTRPSDQLSINESQKSAAQDTKKVYDTITKTRYLTTMAKDHYGNFNLWPYIYEENKAILGHPDRIKPGTKVVVPDLRKYGVDPNNPEDIAKAKRKGVEIYSRYK